MTMTPALARKTVWSAASRTLATTVGAYATTALMVMALARVLIACGVDAVEAVGGATIASFAIFAAIAMAAFHARTALKAWTGLGIANALCGAILLLIGNVG